jgi:hypothetical protein
MFVHDGLMLILMTNVENPQLEVYSFHAIDLLMLMSTHHHIGRFSRKWECQ